MRISDYIAQDLAARLESGSVPGELTLSSLAKHYEVSLTPVRTALDALVEKRYLTRKENGRIELGPRGKPRGSKGGRAPRATEPPPHLTQPADLEALLAREVLLLSLSIKEETFMREEAMAEKHGIGRSPLRSVFQRLAGSGLLEHVPRRGWRVPAFQQDEMDAWIDIRETLEIKAFDMARPRLDPERLDRMILGNGPEAAAKGELDNSLHAYFIELSGNRFFKSFFESSGRYYNALFDYAALGASVVNEMAEQHVEILEHAGARRWAMARRALSHHIQSQQPVMRTLIAALERGGDR